MYSPDLDPSSSAFDTQAVVGADSADGKKPAAKTMADLINVTLRDEMKRDERIVIFGEDVADCQPGRVSEAQAGERQGRSIQADLRLAVRVWQ